LNLTTSERRRCLLIGMGAGIGAIFRAPLGGAVLASEMMYREDIESDVLIPALIGSIAGYTVFSVYGGFQPLFTEQGDVVFDDPIQLPHFALIGIITGLVGLLFIRTYHQAERLFLRIPVALPLRTMAAGVAVGIIGIFAPQTLETGYGWIQEVIDGNFTEISLLLLLLLPLLKVVTTSLTVGSGTSGGVFGPAVFIGGMLGAAYWRLFEDRLPGMPVDPASMTIIAMIAYLGAVSHVPLAAMLMVAEMTRNLSLLAPAMVALGIASLIVGPETLFRNQLPAKSDSPVHRHRYAFPLLSTIIAGEAMQTPTLVLHPGQSVGAAEELLHDATLTGAPVVDDEDRLVGVLTARDIVEVPEEERGATYVIDLMAAPKVRHDSRVSLDEIFDSMANENLGWIPITDGTDGMSDQLVGIITSQSIFSAYQLALRRKVRRTDSMVVGSTLLEVQVTEDSILCGTPVRDLQLPGEALLVSYTRREVVRFPHGNTVFEPGDKVGVVTSVAAEERIRRYFEDETRVVRASRAVR
jgi:CIC family chloride channel protein